MRIVHGRYVWTGEALLERSAVLCDKGIIVDVGPDKAMLAAHPHVPRTGGDNSIVFPGLINAHHHGNGISSFLAGVYDDALEPWLARLGEAPAVDPYLDTLWAALGLLAGGFTTVAIFQSVGDPDRTEEDAKARIQACIDAGLRVAFGVTTAQQNLYVYGPDPAGLPPRRGLATDTYIELLASLRDAYADEPMATVFAAPSGPQWVTDETWEALGPWTAQNNVPLHTHCLESPYELEYARRTYEGGSAVKYLDSLGALHRHTSLVHGVYLTDEELHIVRDRGASLITNPGSNLRLRCGVSPVLRAMETGVPFALGTDSCSLGERDDAFAEMRLLLNLQRDPGMKTAALNHRDVLKAATVTAASVTPWDQTEQRIGRIAPGYWADFSIFDFDAITHPWIHPGVDPVDVTVQRAFQDHLTAVVTAGQLVWTKGEGATKVSATDTAPRLQSSMAAVQHGSPRGDSAAVEKVRQFYEDWPDRPISG